MNDRTSLDEATESTGRRVVAVDAFRGFVLFSFCMAKAFVPALSTLPASPSRDWSIRQLTHSEWHGCTSYNLGFPAFIILIALAMSLSIHRKRRRGHQPTSVLLRKLVMRSAILFLIATLFHGGFSVPLEEVRFTRVLHRLAIAILMSGLFEIFLGTKGKIVALLAVLLGYWALMEFVPVPEFGAGDYSPRGNLNHYVDRTLLRAETYFILSTLGVAGTCLFGGLGGALLLSDRTPWQRVMWYFGAGLLLINLSLLWNVACPINKHIWTPSFVAYSAGWTSLAMSGFYFLADVCKWTAGLFPLTVLGQNSLFTYVAFVLLPFDRYADLFAGEGIVPFVGSAQPFLHASLQVLLLWMMVYWLYRKKLFVKM